MLMPIIFTVSFLWAPAGLVVYWFVSNLLAIGLHKQLANRILEPWMWITVIVSSSV